MKLLTTLCLAVGLMLFLPYGELLAHPPSPNAPKVVRRAYAEKILLLNALQVVCIAGAGFGAVLIVKKARKEYRELSAENMKHLLEGKE